MLRGIGLSDEDANSSLRVSFGRFTTKDDINYATDKIIENVQKYLSKKKNVSNMIDAQSLKQFSFAGHDTFHLRYAWLPKAAEYLQRNKGASLNKYDEIMANLGIGKNMATSLRHWAESSQL